MKKKFYHGTEITKADKIIACGYINEGCICDDKKFAKSYANGNGYVFTVLQDWPIKAIMKLLLERILLYLFRYNEEKSEWLYDKGIIPHNCTEYVNDIYTGKKDRELKYIKAEKVEEIKEQKPLDGMLF